MQKTFTIISLCTLFLLCLSKINAQPILPEDGEIYSDDVVPRIDITINPDTLEWIYQHVESDIEFHADFQYNNGTINETVEDVGFRLRGNTSRYSAKKSFKISFNTYESGRDFYGLEKMNLNGEHNDPSVVRAKLCWDLLRWSQVPAPRSNHVQVYINGNYYGLYISVEHIDEEFAESRFGNKDGNLYKCLYPADLSYIGPNPDQYKLMSGDRRVYDLKTNTELDDYSDLAHFIDVLNNTPINQLANLLEPIFNVQDYLKIMALDVITSNWDGYIFNKNNFYLYHNTKTGKFEYIPYDLDNTFGIDWFNIAWPERDIYNWDNEYRPLYERLLQVDKYKEWYSYYLKKASDELLEETAYFSYLNQIRDKIYPYILNDPYYPMDYGFSPQDFLDSYEEALGMHVHYGIKEYIQIRRNTLNNQIIISDIYPVLKYFTIKHTGPNRPVTINVFAEDDHANLLVELNYTIDNISQTPLTMFDDGLHGDGVAGDNFFGYVFEDGFPDPTILTFQTKGTDNIGQVSADPIIPKSITIFAGDPSLLFINEVMADNASTIADENGEFDDWFEIYNGGDEPVWLGDKFLSDNLDNPSKWPCPDYAIQPAEYLIVWADEDQSQGLFHTNFKLSKDGEEIGLFDNEASGFAVIDQVTFGAQQTDVSYGRDTDGGEEWVFYQYPTPGISNSQSVVIEPVASQNQLILYPNPVSGNNYIFLKQAVSFSVYNSTGKLICQIQESSSLDITGFPAGLYFLTTIDGNAARFIVH